MSGSVCRVPYSLSAIRGRLGLQTNAVRWTLLAAAQLGSGAAEATRQLAQQARFALCRQRQYLWASVRIKTKKPCQGRVSFGLTGACNTLSQGLGEISALAGWDTRPGKPILSRKLSPVQLPASPDTSSRRLESRCFGPGKVIATDQGDLFTVAGIAGQVRPARARRQWQGSVKPQPRALSLS